MGQDGVDFVLKILVPGQNFPLFYLLDDVVDKLEPLAVSSDHFLFAGQIDDTLLIGSGLALAADTDGSLHQLDQITVVTVGGNGLHHGAAQLQGQGVGVNDGLLLFVDVGLIQCHHNRDAKLQQLGSKKQAAAQIGGIHNVDNGIEMLVADIGTGNALLRSEGRHGVGAGKVNGDQFPVTCIGLLDGGLLLIDGDTCPVAHLFVAARQGVVHGGLAAVGIAGKRDSHGISSLYCTGVTLG